MERGSKNPLVVNINHMLAQTSVAKYSQIMNKFSLELVL
jgi:hypothetical protein